MQSIIYIVIIVDNVWTTDSFIIKELHVDSILCHKWPTFTSNYTVNWNKQINILYNYILILQ